MSYTSMKNALLQRTCLLSFRGQTTLRYRLQTPLCSSLPQPPSKYPPRKEKLSNLSSRFCLNEPPIGLPGTSFLAPADKHLLPPFYAFRKVPSLLKDFPDALDSSELSCLWSTTALYLYLALLFGTSAPQA